MRHQRVYLRNLLNTAGHDIDWHAFGILAAHDPQLVCVLIDAACQLGCAAALDDELNRAAHDLADKADPDTVAVIAPLIVAVTTARGEVNERRETARARFAAACHAIGESGFGVLWPATRDAA